jgi:hypothetical protein
MNRFFFTRCPMTCVLSLILARGLQDQAFVDFSSVNDLTTQTRQSKSNCPLEEVEVRSRTE